MNFAITYNYLIFNQHYHRNLHSLFGWKTIMNAILTTNPLQPSFNKSFIYNLLMNVRRERKDSVSVKIIKRHILLSIRSADGTITVSTRSISNRFNQNVGLTRLKATTQQKLHSLIISAFYFITWREMNEDNFTCTWCLFTSPAMKPARFSKRSGYEEIIDAEHPPRIYPGIFRVLLTYSSTRSPKYVATKHANIYWNKRKYSHKKKAQLQQPLVWYVQVEVFCQFPSSSPHDLNPSPTRWRYTPNSFTTFRFLKNCCNH